MMKTFFICAAVLAVMSFSKADTLIGTWQSRPNVNGDVRAVEFKPDNTYDAYFNGRLTVQGNYSVNGDTITITDELCNEARGIYKLNFFSGRDSVRFILIEDECIARAMAVTSVTMGRTKVEDILTGKWQSKPSDKGNVTGVIFKGDNTFEGFVNKKPFVTGQYTLNGDTFSFVDNGCDGKRGIYKLDFFSNRDSLRFIPVMDSCVDRLNGMSRLIVGKVK